VTETHDYIIDIKMENSDHNEFQDAEDADFKDCHDDFSSSPADVKFEHTASPL
jgi:hypothetical protein